MPLSNPRVFVLVEKGGETGIVEEFVGKEGSECYWTNSVLEVVVGGGGGGKVKAFLCAKTIFECCTYQVDFGPTGKFGVIAS
ncbi:hypothetical protein CRYUN_Cryun13aG0146300 [Craigia yunnanensis]